MAAQGLRESQLLGVRLPTCGRAGDDLDDERLAALDHPFVDDAIEVKECAPWMEPEHLDFIDDHLGGDHCAAKSQTYGECEVRSICVFSNVGERGIRRVRDLKSFGDYSHPDEIHRDRSLRGFLERSVQLPCCRT